ncbi:hypothetical protein EBR56_02740, partial [bacterium]|nr:hypothetical protein [bacterium]
LAWAGASLVAVADPAAGDEAKLTRWHDAFAKDVRPVLEAKCLSCHSGDKPEGDFDLSPAVTAERPIDHAGLWDRVAARVRLHSEAHARLLERNAAFAALERTNAELAHERQRADRLLHAVLPPTIAERLKSGPQVIADLHAEVTVLFADMVGFTTFTTRHCPREVVDLLDEIFARFDRLALTTGVEKIKTIGDAWMAVAGLPEPRPDHAAAAAGLALDLQSTFAAFADRRGLPLRLRVGMHSGPVVAGVIGRGRPAYDLWGDTVNLASRMESHAEPGGIQVSATTAALLGDAFVLVDRGPIEVKGIGPVQTAFLQGRRTASDGC